MLPYMCSLMYLVFSPNVAEWFVPAAKRSWAGYTNRTSGEDWDLVSQFKVCECVYLVLPYSYDNDLRFYTQ